MKEERITGATILKQKYEDGKIYYLIDFEWIHTYFFGLCSSKIVTRENLKFRSEDEVKYYINHVWRPSKQWDYHDDFCYSSGLYIYPIVNGENTRINIDNGLYFKSGKYTTLKDYIESVSKDEIVVSKFKL